jgi:serine/threonine-protein kinase
MPMPMPSRMNDVSEMPVMPPTARDKSGSVVGEATDPRPDEASPAVESRPDPLTQPLPHPSTQPQPSAPNTARTDDVVLRTVDQLLDALREPNARGGLLRIACDADWVLPGTVVRTGGSFRIRAEPGASRPKLRFVPAQGEPLASSAWASMIDLRAGTLQLEGIDVVLPGSAFPRDGRWTAFTVRPATELSLSGCTVTVESDRPASAVVSVRAGDNEEEPGVNDPDPSAATVRFTDSLLRTGGDLLDVAAGRRLGLELVNTVVSTGGCVLHAHGLPRGQTAENISLKLTRVTARAAGGLVQLESATGEPELPVASVMAIDSILATSPQGAPLLRVDGQDALSTVRDRIDWTGHGVGYHQINTYRRDQSAQVGALPNLYDRQSWTVAVGARESTPVFGDLKFRREWDPTRPSWTLRRDDVQLAPDSPMRASGSDLERIPNPPQLP